MRHGEAERHATNDASRELVPNGIKDVARVAGAFSKQFDPPHTLVHSPYERARQTAEVVNQALAVADVETWGELVPTTDVGPVVARLAGTDDVMLVTHQPLIGLLAEWLTGEHVVVHPSTLLVIETETLAAGWGEIKCVITA